MTNRMKIILTILIFYISLNFLSHLVSGAVVINEIMYDVIDSDDNHEWIELYNNGPISVDLTGWKFFEANTNHGLTLINGTVILGVGEFAVIVDDWQTFLQDYPSYNKTLFDSSFSLSNTGESLALKNSTLDIIENLTYNSTWGGNGTGKSLERINVSENPNISSNWAESTIFGGTPGNINSVIPPDHDLSISSSEIYFIPPDPSPRLVLIITATIRNLGANNETNINVSFYNISDSNSTLINSTLLNISKQSSQNLTISWNNISVGNFTILISIQNVSAEANLTNNNATKNVTIASHLIINEIMYNPPEEIGSDTDFEWIELYNNATYTENLTGWSLKCDTETASPKTKSLTGYLNSGSYLVLAKDNVSFYNYYSRSIRTEKETCSLNNDGEKILLVFNDSGIYYEEEVSYSPSWGADGTGYSLEKINPTTDNNPTNWAESKAYSGTPGARNNPDNQIKSSLKNPSTAVVYRTTTETVYSNKTEETPDYKIVSLPDVVYINEPFKAVVSLHSSDEQIVTVYSYVYDGRKILSDGFDGDNWKGTWTANKKEIKIGPTPVYAEFENKIKFDVNSGKYQFKVRIKDEIDLTRYIEVLPEKMTQPIDTTNISDEQLSVDCEQIDNQVRITINSPTEKLISLLHFSNKPTENETLNVNGNLTYALNLEDGYNSIILVENDKILDSCSFSLQKTSPITGRTTQVTSISKIFTIVKSWLEKLRFLSIFRNT